MPQPGTAVPMPPILLPFEDSFDQGLSDHWEILAGNIRVVDGQLTTSSGDYSNILSKANIGSTEWRNYAVDVNVTSSDEYTTAMVVVRDSGTSRMVFQFSGAWYCQAVLVSGGVEEEVASSSASLRRDRTHHIRVEVKGDLYQVYLDGDRLFSYYDKTLVSGKVGLWMTCRNPNCNFFDNLRITPLD